MRGAAVVDDGALDVRLAGPAGLDLLDRSVDASERRRAPARCRAAARGGRRCRVRGVRCASAPRPRAQARDGDDSARFHGADSRLRRAGAAVAHSFTMGCMVDRTLLLVDGSSYLYRAYHALPDLRGPGGVPTGAIRGMVSMMKLLREQYPAAHGACVFDDKGKTFRDDWYPEYKATRTPMPDDLALQIEPIHRGGASCSAGRCSTVPGIEADDVIGTLACMAAKGGFKVVDLDRRQGPGAAGRRERHADQHDEQREARRRRRAAKFGVPPERIVDYLDADRRLGRQHAGRREGRAEDGGEVDRRVRLARGRDRARRRRSRASSARTCARRSTGCRRAGAWSPS